MSKAKTILPKSGAHREGKYRCNASKCPGHKKPGGLCTLL